MSVSVRVIDCVYGRPATGLSVSFSRQVEGVVVEQWQDHTDDDGRISGLPEPSPPGSYTVELDLDGYFRTLGYAPLNSAISLRFHVTGKTRHYGLFLLITPASCLAFREDWQAAPSHHLPTTYRRCPRMVAESIWTVEDLAVPDVHSVPQDVRLLPITDLIAADSPRLAGINKRHAEVLAESDDELPPILVQKGTMRIIDGMHRIHAAQLKGRTRIAARLVEIDDDAAFLLAVHSNIAHGLPLSLADRKAAAARIIQTNSFWSDRAIAKAAGLSGKTVGVLREREKADGPPAERRMGQDGKVRPISGATGRRLAGELLAKKPAATVREIAKAAGVSAATVRDVRERLRRGEDALTPGQQSQTARGAAPDAGPAARGPAPHHGAANDPFLEKLMRDPSLRYSNAGRSLLRILHMRPSSLAAQELIKALPPHCLTMTAQASRQIALEWVNFAATIDERRRAETA